MAEFKSNAFHFREFLESTVWQDMKTEMDNALELVRLGMENTEDTNDFLRFQGDARSLRRLMIMPEVILEEIEENEIEKEQSRSDETYFKELEEGEE